MMSKKNYVQFAEMFKGRRNEIEILKPENMEHTSETQIEENKMYAIKIADIFQSNNPNFDRNRFLIACGLDSVK